MTLFFGSSYVLTGFGHADTSVTEDKFHLDDLLIALGRLYLRKIYLSNYHPHWSLLQFGGISFFLLFFLLVPLPY